jgi:hypothetical protein
MKGRTIRSLTRGMEEWHRQLAMEKSLYGLRFEPSGLSEGIWELKTRHGAGAGKIIWTMEEILCSKELQEEGRLMKHCVYSYTTTISKGICSIWSLRVEGQRALTVEVDHGARKIVQARGKCNRPAKPAEINLLLRWARENRLEVGI